ncbi:MAG: hypothetical protein EDS66_01385 [Planctomycetota bacterium]|nr:MAG: hypothetical protein EDS66_01385 [Planctomycetota bacterium]KAB2942161.1 MAG: hypothetical protein F9K17_12575 [Phycisphaerae bacterium]MCQ3922233.1 hypothetical protein [Planctomycetota bacterium]
MPRRKHEGLSGSPPGAFKELASLNPVPPRARRKGEGVFRFRTSARSGFRDEAMSAPLIRQPDDVMREGVPSYAPEALQFVREGLAHTIEQVHGPTPRAFEFLAKFVEDHGLDWEDLTALHGEGGLPPRVVSAIQMIGGPEKLNRHVRGGDLCWGLRDLAMQKWGLMARAVLQRWGVRTTLDFGRIVFEAIERGQMQKQPGDALEDFADVYDFDKAFDRSFRVST